MTKLAIAHLQIQFLFLCPFAQSLSSLWLLEGGNCGPSVPEELGVGGENGPLLWETGPDSLGTSTRAARLCEREKGHLRAAVGVC